MLKGQLCEPLAVRGKELVGCDDQCACSQFHQPCKCRIEIVLAARLQHMQGFQALIGIEKSRLAHRPSPRIKISFIRFAQAR
jgi:hypothetical protein